MEPMGLLGLRPDLVSSRTDCQDSKGKKKKCCRLVEISGLVL